MTNVQEAASTEHLDAQALRAFRPEPGLASIADVARRRAVAVTASDGREAGFVFGGEPDELTRAWAYLIAPRAMARQRTCEPGDFDAWLEAWQHSVPALQSERGEPRPGQRGEAEALEVSLVGATDPQSPVVRFVTSLLFDAMRLGASDAHLEAVGSGLVARLRLDGVLVDAGRLDLRDLAKQVVSRIKVLSALDISEQRLPQDGRISALYRRRKVDIRVSIMPSIHGEDVVLRILDRQHLAQSLQGLSLASLGFDADTVSAFTTLCRRPYGLVLVTGPTGSGKTTTLYAALAQTRDPQEKVITIEDPVEYQIDGVLQIPVNERKGLTFARGLRSILRHDPDRILVGEIRDRETAEIAIQSALTGHLVYTTVHANDAFDVLGRFAQFGLDLYGVASALSGVLAQRLVRLLCTACRQPLTSGSASRYRAAGCDACRGTGYRGRKAIGELLLATPEVKASIARADFAGEIRTQAMARGGQSLRDRAIALMERGETSADEVDRVTLAA